MAFYLKYEHGFQLIMKLRQMDGTHECQVVFVILCKPSFAILINLVSQLVVIDLKGNDVKNHVYGTSMSSPNDSGLKID